MPKVVQEKFEVRAPASANDDAGGRGWASVESALKSSGGPRKKNALPPGANIENQQDTAQHAMPKSMGGETDVSHDANVGALEKGYTKKACSPFDDEYTRSHNDAFYDDVGGFVERNNVLDRL